MHTVRRLTRVAAVVLMAVGSAVWYGCADRAAELPTGPTTSPPPIALPTPDLRLAIAAQRRHTESVLAIPGVVGTAVGTLPDGRAGMVILLERPGVAGLPTVLDGIPVRQQVTGHLLALNDPTTRQRPAPLGFSVGHPAITAGTIGARVRDASGKVYILSNNHVLANSNDATIGDPAYQPGPIDGGTSADQIATLADFEPITFTGTANNTMDAAIALSSTADLDNATPAIDGYGAPNSAIYGDADGDGLIDDPSALLGVSVQKYGRTTGLTQGQITGVNATVVVCYQVQASTCVKSARFVNQLIITPGSFSDGGDSGSLIVTDDGNLNPVALVFAGSPSMTIGSRIDLVLERFGVSIDGVEPPPPGPLNDVEVSDVIAPASVVVGDTASIGVTVTNVGTQDVASDFDVTLRDATEDVTLGSQVVGGLAAGVSATVTFDWAPTATGDHSLVGSHTSADDRSANDQRAVTVAVDLPVTDVAVTVLNAPQSVIEGDTVDIGVTVANVGNQDVATDVTVTLRDTTAGVTLGTQTVGGLAAGAGNTLTFSWNTSSASLGGHGLEATHGLTDDDGSNNARITVVTVNPKPTDIAVTGITAPPSVFQGDTALVAVAVENVGQVDVGVDFDVVLTDGTAGGTIDTHTVAGLAVGTTTTIEFSWATAGAAIGTHHLFATQQLADDSSANNSMAIAVDVESPPAPSTDVAVTGVNLPVTVTEGSTVSVGVTIQNVGAQDVANNFDLVLTDTTAGVTLGTQTVTELAAGATVTRTFSWNTTGAALGGHTLVATHSLPDGNAANDQSSATVTVNAAPTDIALTGITAPPQVTQGDTANVVVTVENVGGVDVGSFAIELTDGTAGGVTVGSQTVAGLTAGATTTIDIPWATVAADTGTHILFATQQLPDDDPTNNSIAIGIKVNPPVIPTDIAVTAVNAPGSVIQGSTVSVGVEVRNVGGQSVGSFDLVLTDATAGVTLGTQTVTGLPAGASTTRTFSWNTTGAAPGGHTLTATQQLPDDNTANDQASATVTVDTPSTDIAVTGVSAPGTVTQGSTANVGVTVENVGGQDVTTNFDLILTDGTAGITIGTQTLAGLAAGASVTRTFSWNTTNAALGNHTLVAVQALPDDNAANDEASTTVTVSAPPTDIGLTGITAPPQVTQGDTAHVMVTVQNTGGVDVGASFDIVLTDGTAGGVTVGTQTVAGLAAGATTTVDIPWATAGADTNTHILIATQQLADDDPTNNSIAIGIKVNAPVPPTDIAVTGVNAPGTVTRGNTVSVGVEIRNVGGQSPGSFDLVLTDATAGVTIGTQTVTWLPPGASTTRTFSWNTTGTALGSHTLVATQSLPDDNAANDQASTTATVEAPSTDVAVTGISAPGTVNQGSTVGIGVTVENVGGQDVTTSFDVVLTDETAGVTLGTQTVTWLPSGASTTRIFSWNTTGAAAGGHTLMATHTLPDDNAANDQQTVTVTVNSAPADIALTGITAPPQVTLGDTAHVVVTVRNVGGVDVPSSFDVVLSDGTAGWVTVGAQTVAGLAAGATTTVDIPWVTAGAATGTHMLFATQQFADNNPTNNSIGIGINVNAPSLHVGDLDGVATKTGGTWSATIEIAVHDAGHSPVSGALVHGIWNGVGSDWSECTTGQAGTCTVDSAVFPNSTRQVSFAPTGVTLAGHVFQPGGNHDVDGSTNGWSIVVRRP